MLRTLLVVLALFLAGCSDPEGSEPDPTPDPTPEPTPDPTPEPTPDPTPDPTPRGSRTFAVTVDDNSFAPANIEVKLKDIVEWTHVGSNPHSVTADDGSFDSHPDCGDAVTGTLLDNCMGGGDSFDHTFTTTGTVPYHCKIHGGMTGTILVTG